MDNDTLSKLKEEYLAACEDERQARMDQWRRYMNKEVSNEQQRWARSTKKGADQG